MSATPWNSNGNAKRKLIARLRAEGRPCHLCGKSIDYTLPPSDPMSFSLDHIRPISKGGALYDYENAAASHRLCNMKKGNRIGDADRAGGLAIVRTREF